MERLQEEKRLEQIRRKERTEAYLYITVNVLLEDNFDGHQGNDLYDPEHALYRVFRVRKQCTLHEFLELLSDSLVSVLLDKSFILLLSSYYISNSWLILLHFRDFICDTSLVLYRTVLIVYEHGR